MLDTAWFCRCSLVIGLWGYQVRAPGPDSAGITRARFSALETAAPREDAPGNSRLGIATVAQAGAAEVFTASVAHEVSQPLSGVIINAHVCLRMLADDPPETGHAQEAVRRIIRDGRRAVEIVARLRALFGQLEMKADMVDLNEAASEVIASSASDLRQNGVILHTELEGDLPLIIGDRVQLQQVILNLLRNASDAMASVDDRPKNLVIKTGREDTGAVRLSVKDAGVGLDLENIERLFQPFYTTKREGMGIGLFVSRSIIERHNGHLTVAANDGPGVTFSFSVPGVCREMKAIRSLEKVAR